MASPITPKPCRTTNTAVGAIIRPASQGGERERERERGLLSNTF